MKAYPRVTPPFCDYRGHSRNPATRLTMAQEDHTGLLCSTCLHLIWSVGWKGFHQAPPLSTDLRTTVDCAHVAEGKRVWLRSGDLRDRQRMQNTHIPGEEPTPLNNERVRKALRRILRPGETIEAAAERLARRGTQRASALAKDADFDDPESDVLRRIVELIHNPTHHESDCLHQGV